MTERVSKPTAAHPLTATLAWSPDQNGGAVSMLRGRVPLATIVGALAAGETVETVADEFGCTVDDARVAVQLVEDLRDGLFELDPKSRGPAYERGYRDGINAQRAMSANDRASN